MHRVNIILTRYLTHSSYGSHITQRIFFIKRKKNRLRVTLKKQLICTLSKVWKKKKKGLKFFLIITNILMLWCVMLHNISRKCISCQTHVWIYNFFFQFYEEMSISGYRFFFDKISTGWMISILCRFCCNFFFCLWVTIEKNCGP